MQFGFFIPPGRFGVFYCVVSEFRKHALVGFCLDVVPFVGDLRREEPVLRVLHALDALHQITFQDDYFVRVRKRVVRFQKNGRNVDNLLDVSGVDVKCGFRQEPVSVDCLSVGCAAFDLVDREQVTCYNGGSVLSDQFPGACFVGVVDADVNMAQLVD